jgi:hypothetical protein
VLQRKEISFKQTIDMWHHPANNSSAIFGYTDAATGGWASIIATHAVLSGSGGLDPILDDIVYWTQRSMGRMQLHVALTLEGMQIIPMRMGSSVVREELRHISFQIQMPEETEEHELKELLPDIYDRIQVLIDTPVDEIH